MGESKRRRERDPNYGKETIDPEIKNIFFVEEFDGEHLLVINTKLAKKGFILPKGENLTKKFDHFLSEFTLRSLTGDSRGGAYCHVENHPELHAGDLFYGVLNEHPRVSAAQGRFPRFLSVQKINK